MPDNKTAAGVRTARLILLLAIALCIVIIVWMNPSLIRFWPFTAGEVVQLLTPLFLIALFIERALEVFLTVWRAGGSANVELEVRHFRKLSDKNPATHSSDLLNSERLLSAYKAETQKIAFICGIAFGIVVSAFGVRSIELFVDPDVFRSLPGIQRSLFNVVDVILTGALLGGGADGMHKLVSVFTNYMDATSKKIKGEPV